MVLDLFPVGGEGRVEFFREEGGIALSLLSFEGGDKFIYLSQKDDLSEMSADYGLHLVRMGNEVMSGEAICFEELNLSTLTNVLVSEVNKNGGEIDYGTEVTSVEKEREEFKVSYKALKGEGEEKVDVVIFALSLFHVESLMPQLKLENNIEYPKNKIIVSSGKLRYPDQKLIMGLPGNPHNLRLFLNFMPTEQYFLPWDMNKGVDLDLLYKSHKLVLEREVYPLPVMPPSPKVPNLKTEIDNVYLAGDFYYYPYDTAALTDEKVAKMIKEG